MLNRQHGQALPLGLALALVAALGALVLYNTGQLASDKARLANAADAAAYSGARWQARALNFQAYANRAMVANQVSMAQAVSLHSWVGYGDMTARNIATVLAAVPYVNAIARGTSEAMDAVRGVVRPIADAAVGVLDTVNGALSASQQAMFASSFAATPETVRAVVAASDPRFTAETRYSLAGLATNLADWNDFTERHDADDLDAMEARAALVNASRDRFTARRDWEFFDNFWFYSSPITRHKVFREGETRLIASEEGGRLRWELKAKDTVALHNEYYRFVKGWKGAELPIGFAESFANASGAGSVLDGRCRRRGAHRLLAECARWLDENRKSESWAAARRDGIGGYHGLRPFRTLSESALAVENDDPVMALRVEVALPLESARTSEEHVVNETFATALAAPGEMLSSISVAEVYYRRPLAAGAVRGDPLEAANGYNPFWDTRLAPVSDAERLIALGLRGGGAVAGAGGAPPAADRTPALAGATAGTATAERFGASLPDYAETLAAGFAGGMAGEPRVASDERLRLAGRPLDLLDAEAAVEEIERVLEDELADALRRAIAGMLGGAVRAAVPAGLDGVAGEVAAAAAEARRFSEELERLRTDVARDFEPVFVEELRRAQREHRRLRGRISELRDRQQDADSSRRYEYIAPIKNARDGLRDLDDALRDRLAERLVEIVDERSGGSWPMPLRMGRDVVAQMLAGLPSAAALAARADFVSIDEIHALIDADENLVDDALPWGEGDAEDEDDG